MKQIENPIWLQLLPRTVSKATLKKNDAAGRGSDQGREDGLAAAVSTGGAQDAKKRRLRAREAQQNCGAMTNISVIIPAYGHCPHLLDLLRAILDGERRPDEIIVSHSGPHDPTAAVAEVAPPILVLHSSARLLGGAARNRGAGAAAGTWLAFVDADVRPTANWLAALIAGADREPERFVVGSVGYATSGGYWGLCNWICEFSEQAPWRPAGRQTGGASCNMIVRSSDFRAAGGFPEDHQPGEDTLLFARLGELGRRQWFDPAARVDHHNQAGLRALARHQHRLGIHSALVRQQVPLRGSLATRIWPLVLVLWIPRIGLMARRIADGGPEWWLRGIALAPGLLLGSWIWTAGFLQQVLSGSREIARVAPDPNVRR